jgi:hypothetical protein
MVVQGYKVMFQSAETPFPTLASMPQTQLPKIIHKSFNPYVTMVVHYQIILSSILLDTLFPCAIGTSSPG